jgi:phenylalanine ammonia-lyase
MLEISSRPTQQSSDYVRSASVVVSGAGLTIEQVGAVAYDQTPVQISSDPALLARIHASHDYVMQAVQMGTPIYGVTSGFGGMAHVMIGGADAAELQNNLVWYHKTGSGRRLPRADVRAAMLLRLNSHMRGASGIRLELLQRLERFLNANVTPHVLEFGSIGASGDLVPLTYITGALIGTDACFTVDFDGAELDALTALDRLGLRPLSLQPKEGLAMVNGTSVMTGIAANVVCAARRLFALALGAHALMIQALRGTNQSFHPFVHLLKPHPGQRWSAEAMLALLRGSQMSRDELDGQHDYRGAELIQDRYSLRCLAQFFGPLADGLAEIGRQVEVELNSATDNPLIDTDAATSYHGGNFLGQYIGAGMDRLRYLISLLSQHLDAQIALLVTPEFNHGLPACLVGNRSRRVNMGLKGLQIAGNSLVPMLAFLGNGIADRFPTHAEQFNQNINSQGFNAANLARRSIEILEQYMAAALIFAVQAADLRCHALTGQYDPRAQLSPATAELYSAVRAAVGHPPSAARPYLWDDHDRPLDYDQARIAADISANGRIPQAVSRLTAQLSLLPS